jgi:hypothetical protein
LYVCADPEAHALEDAVCLTFLQLQFVDFSAQLSDTDKLVGIVRKTWAKMTPAGQALVASELLGGLPANLRDVIHKALAEGS